MYKVTHFDKKLCRLLRRNVEAYLEDCDIYSIWRFCPSARWKAFKNFFAEASFCHAEWFPIIYWIVLTISAFGTCYSLMEFARLYWGCRKNISMWRQRKYYILPYCVLRRCRLVGALVMLNAWFLLWYAVVNVSPTHMTPWITINMCLLSFEILTWFIEVMFGVTKLELNTLVTFMLPVANFIFVNCVRKVFLHAIELNDIDDLRLWKHTFK